MPAAAAAATTTSDTDAARAKASLFVYDPLALGKVSRPLLGAWHVNSRPRIE